MKKFIAIISCFIILVVITPGPTKAAPLPIVQGFELSAPAPSLNMFNVLAVIPAPLAAMVQQDEATELDAPNVGLEDVLNIPGKESTTATWLKWIIGVLLFVFYEFIAGSLKTKKSWKIFAILYNLSNKFIKDKTTDNKVFTIKRE